MLKSDTIELKKVEMRAAIDSFDPDTGDPDDLLKLTAQYRSLDAQFGAAIVQESHDKELARAAGDLDSGQRELDGIGRNLQFGNYVAAACEFRSATGAEAEWNAGNNMSGLQFPLALLAPQRAQMRANTDTDGQANQGRWLDRLFAESASMRLGITHDSVPAGVANYMTTTAGVTPGQRSRQQAAADSAWTVGVKSLEPKRNAVSLKYTVEDSARLPGLSDAVRRDMSMGLADAIDQAIFIGDAGATTAADDAVGLNTYPNLTEVTLTQANKIKGPETLAAFVGMVDGLAAQNLGDLNIVSSVGAYRLWEATVINSAADNMTLAAFLRMAGMSWGSRANIDTATANGDFGAFCGLSRGIEGAGVAAIWDAGQMIVDQVTRAKEGEVVLVMNYLWALDLPRADNFARLKFAA